MSYRKTGRGGNDRREAALNIRVVVVELVRYGLNIRTRFVDIVERVTERYVGTANHRENQLISF